MNKIKDVKLVPLIGKSMNVRVNEIQQSPLREYINLNGRWRFALDRDDSGKKSEFWKATVNDDSIMVPGCLEAQGKGLEYCDLKPPAWSGTCDMPYLGTSWYQTEFVVPAEWEGRRITLNFGGVATDCEVWLDDTWLGEHHCASIPFGFDISSLLVPGGQHRITVRVENRHNYERNTPANTHALGSSTIEMRWSGIFRGVELTASCDEYIESVHILPDAAESKADFRCFANGGAACRVKVSSWGSEDTLWISKSACDNPCTTMTLLMPGALLWSDNHPNLYAATIELLDREENIVDSIIERFALRDVGQVNGRLHINDSPVYFRGDLTHYHWPETICWPTDREALRQGLNTYKKYGMNFLRHHTHVPSPEYLEVCDELGLYCHLEPAVTGTSWRLEEEVADEIWDELICRDRNHPSVVWWCMGNEALPSEEDIQRYTAKAHALDSTRPVLTTTPGEMLFPDGNRFDIPIMHELRRCGSSYIDPATKDKYQGALRPWRVMFAEQETVRSALMEMLPAFAKNTQLLQERCRKIVIEEARLQPFIQGYQLATFRDCGSFTWGVVDDFFEEKPGAPCSGVRLYTGETVLLWDLPWHLRTRQYGSRFQEKLPIRIICSHYGEKPLNDASAKWSITDDEGNLFASGERSGINCASGALTQCVVNSWKWPEVGPIKQLRLRAVLKAGGDSWRNEWDFWLHPKPSFTSPPQPVVLGSMEYYLKRHLKSKWDFVQDIERQFDVEDVLVTQKIDSLLLKHLEKGGRALLNGKGIFHGAVTEWPAGRSEYPRGTIVDQTHPLMDGMLCQGWCDVPFAPVLGRRDEINGLVNEMGYAVGLRDWPGNLKPIIAGIPSYKAKDPELYGHLFEVRVGKGRLLISTLEFGSPCALNSFSDYFLDKILRYLCGEDFQPDVKVDLSFIASYRHSVEVEQTASQEFECLGAKS